MTSATLNHLDVPRTCDATIRVTCSPLGYGVLAGVLYLKLWLAAASTHFYRTTGTQ